ncbi:hypothetical protein A1O1_04231 [Capronia coronata CBS 617.96]|uniref:DNA polymerase epsilon subunit D n=1 Tax=Capronia coronata CBS 617.96 TaxID=1182541 RepID=W9Z9D4_9EURO|nr:uncharacterized protein A1O1_04231 [Capronia coronata CBS 617.96]EXJ91124.1 hypothetical protein A1O1_04231 [Capronia coronata CBS 617.96]
MAPRKSNASAAATDANGDVSMVSNATNTSTHAHPKSARQSSGGGKQDDGVSIDDLLLPRTLVSRLARGVLPPNTSIQKDATLALAKSATVFISYLAHHANEQTTKKTLGPQDVLKALKEMEMAGVMELGAVGQDGRLGGRLEREMEAYEEIIQRKRKGYRDKVKARESLAGDGEGGEDGEAGAAERGEPSSKKARRMDDDDDDEEERLLDEQLNGGGVGDDSGLSHPAKAKRKSKSKSANRSSPLANGKARAMSDESDAEDGDEGEDEPADEEDDDQEEGEDEDEEEEEEDDEEPDDEDDEQNGHDTDGLDDVDGSHRPNGRARPLMIGRDVDVGSEDESD